MSCTLHPPFLLRHPPLSLLDSGQSFYAIVQQQGNVSSLSIFLSSILHSYFIISPPVKFSSPSSSCELVWSPYALMAPTFNGGNDSSRWHAWQGCSWTLHLQLWKQADGCMFGNLWALWCVYVCVYCICVACTQSSLFCHTLNSAAFTQAGSGNLKWMWDLCFNESWTQFWPPRVHVGLYENL